MHHMTVFFIVLCFRSVYNSSPFTAEITIWQGYSEHETQRTTFLGQPGPWLMRSKMFQSSLFTLSNSLLSLFSFVVLFLLNWCALPKDSALFKPYLKLLRGVGSISRDILIWIQHLLNVRIRCWLFRHMLFRHVYNLTQTQCWFQFASLNIWFSPLGS